MRSDITPGGLFPDYELPDHTNVRRRLSELQGGDPLILTLAPGHYCPKEHQQHFKLAAFFPRIAVAYTQVATIATDEHHELHEFRASVGAQWTFLSDPGRIVQQDLDIKEYTDPDHDPMIPHTLVLNQGSSSTASITATGSGAGLRSPTRRRRPGRLGRPGFAMAPGGHRHAPQELRPAHSPGTTLLTMERPFDSPPAADGRASRGHGGRVARSAAPIAARASAFHMSSSGDSPVLAVAAGPPGTPRQGFRTHRR